MPSATAFATPLAAVSDQTAAMPLPPIPDRNCDGIPTFIHNKRKTEGLPITPEKIFFSAPAEARAARAGAFFAKPARMPHHFGNREKDWAL